MARAKMVLPNPALKKLADKLSTLPPNVEIQVGNLPQALAETDIAIASTGTVTMECAFFGVPTVTLYKTSWLTYQIGRRIVTVKSLTMPNLLAKRGSFSRIRPKRRHTGKHFQRRTGAFQNEIRASASKNGW